MKKTILLLAVLGFFQSAAFSQTGFFNPDVIQEIRISFPYSNWANQLDSLRLNGDGFLLGSVTINGVAYDNAGVRLAKVKGFQPGLKRNSLVIKLDYINQQQAIEGHSTLFLSNTLRDPSLIREVLGYEIARQYMPAPQANFTKVYINQDLYGLMANVETIESAFLTRNFGSDTGPLFKSRSYDPYDNYPSICKQRIYGSLEYDKGVECYLYNFEKLSESGWDDLIGLTYVLNETPEQVETALHVDRTLWMLAYNNVMVNLSSYSGHHSQNYYLYMDQNGQFSPILWDLNLVFGSFKTATAGSDFRSKQLEELDPYLHLGNPAKPLINQLLSNDYYKKVYLSHMRTILFENFENGKYQERATALQNLIRDAFVQDKNQKYTLDEFNASLTATIGENSKIPGIVEFMTNRTEFLKKHPDLAVLPPKIVSVKPIGRVQFSSVRVETFQIQATVDRFPKRVRLYYRFDDKSSFREALMYDDGSHGDTTAEDGIYSATIVPQSGETSMEYYVVAENASAITFEPSNYMWKRYNTTLEELNK